MKIKKLLFIPLVLATLVSCSNKKDSYNFKTINNDVPMNFYELASSRNEYTYYDFSNFKAEKLESFDNEINSLNGVLGYKSTLESYDIYDMETGIKMYSASISAFNNSPSMNSYGEAIYSINHLFYVFGVRVGYTSYDYYIIDEKGSVIKKIKNIEKAYLYVYNYGGPNSNLVDLVFYSDQTYNVSLLVKQGRFGSVELVEDFEEILFPFYDENGVIKGYYKYNNEEDSFNTYDVNKKYIKTIKSNFGFYDSFFYSYSYSVSLNNYIELYFFQEEYYPSQLDNTGEKYKSYAYKFNWMTGEVTYFEDLPFVIENINEIYKYDDFGYIYTGSFVEYAMLEDGRISSNKKMCLINEDLSSFDEKYSYDSAFFEDDIYKIGTNKYLLSSYDDSFGHSLTYIDSSKKEFLGRDLYVVPQKNCIILDDGEDIYALSKDNFLSDFKSYKNGGLEKIYDYAYYTYNKKDIFVYEPSPNSSTYYGLTSFGSKTNLYVSNLFTYYLISLDDKGLKNPEGEYIYKFSKNESFYGYSIKPSYCDENSYKFIIGFDIYNSESDSVESVYYKVSLDAKAY